MTVRSRLLVALVGALLFAAGMDVTRAEPRLPVDVALVFLADESGSMEPPEIGFVREAHALAITSPEVLKAIQDAAQTGRIAVAYVGFANGAWTRIGWHIVDGVDSATLFAEDILDAPPPAPGLQDATYLGAGLVEANRLFDAPPYEALKRVVDVVGDGKAMDLRVAMEARAAILARPAATINGMPLLLDPSSLDVDIWYAETLAGGPGHFSWALTDIRQMPEALRTKIVTELY